MTKQTLPNRYKEETAEKPTSAETVKKTSFVSRTLKPILIICVFSLTALLVHDVVVQSPFFPFDRSSSRETTG